MRRQFLRIYKRAQWKSKFSGRSYHVDHIIPLHGENVSGLHLPWNLKVIPAVINMAKGIMVIEEDEWLLQCCGGKRPNSHKADCKYAPKDWFSPWGGSFKK